MKHSNSTIHLTRARESWQLRLSVIIISQTKYRTEALKCNLCRGIAIGVRHRRITNRSCTWPERFLKNDFSEYSMIRYIYRNKGIYIYISQIVKPYIVVKIILAVAILGLFNEEYSFPTIKNYGDLLTYRRF